MQLKLSEKEFEKKYKLYSQLIFNISYSYFKSRDNAEDIVQDVFIKYLKHGKFSSCDYEKYWLIRVAINHCKNMIKKKSHVVLVDNQYFNSLVETDNTSNEDKYSNLVCALESKYRNVIILYYYEDMSIIEISKVLKISESAVKMRLKRAREMLKEMEENNDRGR